MLTGYTFGILFALLKMGNAQKTKRQKVGRNCGIRGIFLPNFGVALHLNFPEGIVGSYIISGTGCGGFCRVCCGETAED